MPTWVAVMLATVAVAALLWIAGEEHYQSCVVHNAADIHLSTGGRAGSSYGGADTLKDASDIGGEITPRGGCSRVPW